MKEISLSRLNLVHASAKMEETDNGEEEAIAETKYDFTEDVNALVAGEELSEEFREKAVTIFEAAVTSQS